jgi:signal transduction histidine kinase
LNNAIKLTTNGNIMIGTREINGEKADRKAEQRRAQVEVSIIDTGSGLAQAVLPKLFSKFVSTDSGGTGLGLFVSKNIIEFPWWQNGGTKQSLWKRCNVFIYYSKWNIMPNLR